MVVPRTLNGVGEVISPVSWPNFTLPHINRRKAWLDQFELYDLPNLIGKADMLSASKAGNCPDR